MFQYILIGLIEIVLKYTARHTISIRLLGVIPIRSKWWHLVSNSEHKLNVDIESPAGIVEEMTVNMGRFVVNNN